MTIDQIMQTAEDAAPWILAILAATTVLAHALARAARAFQRYAATTPATWDDVAARRAVRWADRLSAALAWVSALLPRFGFGRPSTVLEDASRRAELGSTRRTSRRDVMRPPPGGPGATILALAIVVTASPALAACGASAVSTHARAALVTTSAVRVAGEVADQARDAALDRVEEAHPVDPEHDEAVRAESARWRPLGQTLDATREALASWVESIELARLAGDDELGIVELLPLATTALGLYARVAALAVELGAEVPPLPGWLSALIGGAR